MGNYRPALLLLLVVGNGLTLPAWSLRTLSANNGDDEAIAVQKVVAESADMATVIHGVRHHPGHGNATSHDEASSKIIQEDGPTPLHDQLAEDDGVAVMASWDNLLKSLYTFQAGDWVAPFNLMIMRYPYHKMAEATCIGLIQSSDNPPNGAWRADPKAFLVGTAPCGNPHGNFERVWAGCGQAAGYRLKAKLPDGGGYAYVYRSPAGGLSLTKDYPGLIFKWGNLPTGPMSGGGIMEVLYAPSCEPSGLYVRILNDGGLELQKLTTLDPAIVKLPAILPFGYYTDYQDAKTLQIRGGDPVVLEAQLRMNGNFGGTGWGFWGDGSTELWLTKHNGGWFNTTRFRKRLGLMTPFAYQIIHRTSTTFVIGGGSSREALPCLTGGSKVGQWEWNCKPTCLRSTKDPALCQGKCTKWSPNTSDGCLEWIDILPMNFGTWDPVGQYHPFSGKGDVDTWGDVECEFPVDVMNAAEFSHAVVWKRLLDCPVYKTQVKTTEAMVETWHYDKESYFKQLPQFPGSSKLDFTSGKWQRPIPFESCCYSPTSTLEDGGDLKWTIISEYDNGGTYPVWSLARALLMEHAVIEQHGGCWQKFTPAGKGSCVWAAAPKPERFKVTLPTKIEALRLIWKAELREWHSANKLTIERYALAANAGPDPDCGGVEMGLSVTNAILGMLALFDGGMFTAPILAATGIMSLIPCT